MSKPKDTAIVVGAGVIGLTTAITLAENGWRRVVVVSDRTTPNTVSDVAASFWYPFLCNPRHRVREWARVAYAEFSRIEATEGGAGAGIAFIDGLELRDNAPFADAPWWADCVPAGRVRAATPAELKALPYAHGLWSRVMRVEMRFYLPYLLARAAKAGVELIVGPRLSRLADVAGAVPASVAADAQVVVNCTGLGARELCDDPRVHPVRGQIVKVHAPHVRHFYLDDDGPNAIAYVVPLRDGVVTLGGTAQQDDYRTDIDDADTRGIIERCSRMVPSLNLDKAPVLSKLAGLRPMRDEVRLEAGPSVLPGGRAMTIHAYGFGGNGVTTSWGAALEIARLAAGGSSGARL